VLNSVIDKVAERLGNTRTVCRQCYVHPAVLEAWLADDLHEELTRANKGKRHMEGLDDEEAVAALVEEHARSKGSADRCSVYWAQSSLRFEFCFGKTFDANEQIFAIRRSNQPV
jgi:hypothetical protein